MGRCAAAGDSAAVLRISAQIQWGLFELSLFSFLCELLPPATLHCYIVVRMSENVRLVHSTLPTGIMMNLVDSVLDKMFTEMEAKSTPVQKKDGSARKKMGRPSRADLEERQKALETPDTDQKRKRRKSSKMHDLETADISKQQMKKAKKAKEATEQKKKTEDSSDDTEEEDKRKKGRRKKILTEEE